MLQRPWTSVVFVVLLICASRCGNARQQDYTVVGVADADHALRGHQFVAEGAVVNGRRYEGPARVVDYLYFWMPHGPAVADRRQDATVEVSDVLRGDVREPRIVLRNYRPLTPAETSFFPDGYGMRNHLRLRIAYNRRRGDRFADLVIVPLGNTAVFDAAMRSRGE